jgi:metal-responsive CopG/Arc/MetJ family transcriptional regulator
MDTQMINFSIPNALLRQADQEAKIESRSRSELLREALRAYLNSEEARRRSFEIMRASAKRINMSEEEAVRLIDEIRDTLPMNQPPKKAKKRRQ